MTLLEVVVAAVLLGVGVAGLISVSTLALRNQRRVDERTTALWLANEQLSEIEVVGPRAWQISRPTHGGRTQGLVRYEWDITLEGLSVGELCAAKVDVSWFSPSGGGAVTLESWLNDYNAKARAAGKNPDEAEPPATPEEAD